jgi:hypothetical protein
MLDHELKTLCKKLKPVLGRRADALWLAYLTAETAQSKREAEVLIQMLVAKHLGQSVSDETILLPPPSREAASGDFLLGTIVYGRTRLFPVYLRPENFIKHIGIFLHHGRRQNQCRSDPLARSAQEGRPIHCGGLEKKLPSAALIVRSRCPYDPNLYRRPQNGLPLYLESIASPTWRSPKDLDQCDRRSARKVTRLRPGRSRYFHRCSGQKVRGAWRIRRYT